MSQDVCEMRDLVPTVERPVLDLTTDQIELFIKNHFTNLAQRRFEKGIQASTNS